MSHRLALGLLLAACSSTSTTSHYLVPTASRDLQCDADEIQLSEPGEQQQRLLALAGAPTPAYASGCGKRLVYARMCKTDGSGCGWYSAKKLRVDQLTACNWVQDSAVRP